MRLYDFTHLYRLVPVVSQFESIVILLANGLQYTQALFSGVEITASSYIISLIFEANEGPAVFSLRFVLKRSLGMQLFPSNLGSDSLSTGGESQECRGTTQR